MARATYPDLEKGEGGKGEKSDINELTSIGEGDDALSLVKREEHHGHNRFYSDECDSLALADSTKKASRRGFLDYFAEEFVVIIMDLSPEHKEKVIKAGVSALGPHLPAKQKVNVVKGAIGTIWAWSGGETIVSWATGSLTRSNSVRNVLRGGGAGRHGHVRLFLLILLRRVGWIGHPQGKARLTAEQLVDQEEWVTWREKSVTNREAAVTRREEAAARQERYLARLVEAARESAERRLAAADRREKAAARREDALARREEVVMRRQRYASF
ncbi:hypothetical protein KEM56_000206 [Ascosphaera pollenicola]|nr:hypothetical protein KEM56_000206 [Ascosphaera pollenicola]